MIHGLSHLTFIVKDLNKASSFFTGVFDAREIYSSGDKTFSLSREKYFMINDLWICVMEGDPATERSYNHVAFQINEEDYNVYQDKIRILDLEIKPSRTRLREEGRSIYFYDYDNHLFELHAGSLTERLIRYSKEE